MFSTFKEVLSKKHIEAGMRVVYANPLADNKLHKGRVRFHAQDKAYWLITPEDDDTLDLIHTRDIVQVIG
jgi:thymidine kinase